MDDIRRLARFFRPYKWSLIIGIACIVAGVVFNVAIPQIVGEAIDANWKAVTWSKLNIAALKVLGASAMSGLFLFLQRRILIGMSRNIEYDLRDDFYRRLVNQPLSFFHEHRTGDLMARATNDLSAVRQLAGPMIMYSLQTVFVVLFILPIMFALSWKLTLLLFVTMPLVSLTVKFFGQQVHTRFQTDPGFLFANHRAGAGEHHRRAGRARLRAGECRDRGFQQFELGIRAKESRAGADRCGHAAADDVSDWVRVCADYLGGRAAGGARRNYGRPIHAIQHVSFPADLAADRDWLRRQCLPARHGKLETHAGSRAREAGHRGPPSRETSNRRSKAG